MRRHLQSLSLIGCILYAGSILLPPLHELLIEEERCVECPADASPGPVLCCGDSERCDDPHHHHHRRGHDHQQCPACHHGPLLGTAPGGSAPAVLPSERLDIIHARGRAPARLLFSSDHPARAPPSFS